MEIKVVDLSIEEHCQGILDMMSAYARDPFGGGEDISDDVKKNLIDGLKSQTNYLGFLLFHQGEAIGMANCFTGFSTFKAKPLLNIHDFAIRSDYQCQGLGKQLMNFVINHAKSLGYCKLTLEVLSGNEVARAAYKRAGFKQYELANDVAEFWQKTL